MKWENCNVLYSVHYANIIWSCELKPDNVLNGFRFGFRFFFLSCAIINISSICIFSDKWKNTIVMHLYKCTYLCECVCVCVEERRQAQIFPQTMIYVGRRRALKVNNNNDELKKQSDCMQLKCSLWKHNNNNNNSINNNNTNVTSQPQRRLTSTKRQQQQLLLRAIQVRNLSVSIRHTVRIFQLTRISTLVLYIVCILPTI